MLIPNVGKLPCKIFVACDKLIVNERACETWKREVGTKLNIQLKGLKY
jgi:hypothetical protein